MAKQKTLLDQINEEKTHKPSKNGQEATDIPSDSEKNLQLGACIMAALDIEREFKLFSYRIINQEAFVDHVQDIARQIKQLK